MNPSNPMNIKHIQTFLDQAVTIIAHYDKIAALTGSNFNIFKTLELETAEVRLHSRFIAELLDPKGTHGQGTIFLDAFKATMLQASAGHSETVKRLEQFVFDASVAVKVEDHIGQINADYTEGGRVDIVMTDAKGSHIFIENKIYAGDSKNQLYRYHNHAPHAALLYLTLKGTPPSGDSVGNLTADQYHCISYKTDIIFWLERCQKEAAALPLIRETINQYINLLKHLTDQSEKITMQNEIKKLISEHHEYAKVINDCSLALQSIIRETRARIGDELHKQFVECNIEIEAGIRIKSHWDEDSDGIFIGYMLFDEEQDKNISGATKANTLKETMKKLFSKMNANDWHIGWYTPEPFARKKFELHDVDFILDLYTHQAKIEDIVGKIIKKDKQMRDAFFSAIGVARNS